MRQHACRAGYAAHVTHIELPLHSLAQQWLQPQWPAIAGVQAIFTTRAGGYSQAPWCSMNLGDHVQDDSQHVTANRAVLRNVVSALSGKDVQPVFMQQVHGCDVQELTMASAHGQAFDACVTEQIGVACTVMVADCLPVLFAHRSGQVVAAAHAGWRGLVGDNGVGVLERTWLAYARKLGVPPKAALAADTQVWLGPCIGPTAFEVGHEVRTAFVQANSQATRCFTPSNCVDGNRSKWLAHLPALARQRLQALGIQAIYGNDGSAPWCTVSNPSMFFSHRRDAAVLGSTGRMAACIWKV